MGVFFFLLVGELEGCAGVPEVRARPHGIAKSGRLIF